MQNAPQSIADARYGLTDWRFWVSLAVGAGAGFATGNFKVFSVVFVSGLLFWVYIERDTPSDDAEKTQSGAS